jgi:SNF2 family DNA or RNA helicase
MRSNKRIPSIPIYLVVCKKGNRNQWIATIKEQDPGCEVEVWEGPDDYIPITSAQPFWVVTHYECVLKLWPLLRKHLWGAFILDEAHRIKNRNAKWTNAIKQIEAVRKLALTATPMERNPADYWSILNWLYPDIFRSYWSFRKKYADIEVSWAGYEKVVGIKNLPALEAELRPFRDRATKESEAKDLPPLIETEVSIELSKAEKDLYKTVRKADDILIDLTDFDIEQSMVVKNKLGRLIKLQQIATDPSLVGASISSTKLSWVDEYIADAPTEKIAVVTKFRDTALMLAHKYGGAIIVGGGSTAGLPTLKDFRHGSCNLLFGTVAAIKEGYDLPEGQTLIFVDVDWSSTAMTQTMNRFHRLGIDAPKNVIYLLAKGTVDAYIYKALRNKWTQKQLLDNWEEA